MSLERLKELENIISKANNAYEVFCDPIMSDAEYDKLKHEYLALFQLAYGKSPDRPVSLIGIKMGARAPIVKHPFPMLSLSNSFSKEELSKALAAVKGNVVIEPKLDGASLELLYNEKGVLFQAVKRGDGIEGESVISIAAGINDIPKEIIPPKGFKGITVIRGEVMLSKSDFEQLNQRLVEQGEKPYVNPRNAAAGALNLKDVEKVKGRKLTFFPYYVRSTLGDYGDHEKYTDFKPWLETQGFRRLPHFYLLNARSIDAQFDNVVDVHFADIDDYELDGLVLKANLFTNHALGETSEGPRYAAAYKFPEEQVTTTSEGVIYQVGHTGQITPVLKVAPVKVSGATINRLTVHNFTKLNEFAPIQGSSVTIKRAGEVIPYLVSCSNAGNAFPIIKHCPVCDSKLITKGELTYCSNDYRCKGRLQAYMEHLLSRKVYNIRDIGSRTIQELIDKGWLKRPSDLWHLSRESWHQLDNVEIKKVNKYTANLTAGKVQECWRFIYACAIPDVGESTARLLADVVGEDVHRLEKLTKEELMALPDIGELTANSIVNYFQSGQRDLFDNLLVFTQPYYIKKQQSALTNKKIVVTGSFAVNRDDIKAAIVNQGAAMVGSVSKSTDYALVGDNPGTKADKIKTLGIPTLTLKDLGL